MANKVMTGVRARFFMDGVRLGYARSVSITETVGQELITVLDSLTAVDVATTSVAWTLRINRYKIPGQDLVNLALWFQAGRDREEFKRNVLNFAPLSAEVFDSFTDTRVAKVWDIYPQSRTLNWQAQGVVVTDATFIALGFGDEGSPQI